MCIRCRKYFSIISSALSLEISLNMFRRSREMRHRVGGFCACVCMSLLMYLSISLVMVWYMKFDPPLIPMA